MRSVLINTGLVTIMLLASCGDEPAPPRQGAAPSLPPAPPAGAPPVVAPPADDPPAVTSATSLSGPYEDPIQAEVPFGRRTWYLAPWRAYMDTRPASQFLNCVGITMNADGVEGEAAAEVLGEAGFRHARIEWGWSSLTWDGAMGDVDARRNQVACLKRNGLRPLILLNAHHGQPCPVHRHRVTVAHDAAAGAREIVLADTSALRAGYTGFLDQGNYIAGYPLIERITDGTCALSAPLAKAVKAGPLELVELKYRPFSGAVNADGTPNPYAAETVRGWMDYVATVCATARTGLGSEGAADAGFDLEVWNEYSFGSSFLDIGNYCSPKPQFREPIAYRAHGREATGTEAILPMTVDWAAKHCPGTKVISGFANQRPWDNGSEMWPGQAGISRHYYTGLEQVRIDPEHVPVPNSGPLDALGKPDGKPDGKDWHTVVPGSFFVPPHIVAMPEWWYYAYKTEFITRDLQPWPSAGFTQHNRFAHPGTGRPAEVWNSETNLFREPFARQVATDAACAPGDPRLRALMHEIGARGLLRQILFSAHKGVTAMTVFACRSADSELGVIPEAFYDLLKQDGGKLTARVRAAAGPQLAAMGRLVRAFADGEAIDVPRKLTLDHLVEHDPRLVFHGDGTPGHPDRWQRDDFACLPFQLAPDRFAIGYYVVTRDMAMVRDPTKGALDIARYAMAPQTYDLTLGNLRGESAQIEAWDPITDRAVPVRVLAATTSSLTVRVSAVDYPRLLRVRESTPGPLPSVKIAGGVAVLGGNVAGEATITWGPWPQRVPARIAGEWKPGMALAEYFADTALSSPRLRRMEPGLALAWSGADFAGWPCENVSARWTCRIRPPATGTYTFTSASDDGQRLWVNGRQLVNNWVNQGVTARSGSIDLVAGVPVDLRWEWFQGGGGYSATLTWTPPGGSAQAIPADVILPPTDANPFAARAPVVVALTPGHEVRVPLAGAASTDAVRVEYRAGDLVARWPQWPHDVRGVLGFAASTTSAAQPSMPVLPELPAAVAIGFAAGAPWQGSAARFTASVTGVEALLEHLPSEPVAALPAASTLDSRSIAVISWNGIPAWQIDDILDPVAHPGEHLLARRMLLCPLPKGCLLLTICAPSATGLAAGDTLAAAVTITR